MDKISKSIENTLKNKKLDYFELLKLSKGEIIEQLSVYHEELLFQNEELVRTNKNLEKSKESFESLFLHTPVPILTIDTYGFIKRINHSGRSFLRIKILNKEKITDYIDEDSQDNFYLFTKKIRRNEATQNHIEIDFFMRGTKFNVIVYFSKESESNDTLLRLAIIDVTHQKQYQNTIEYLATHDQLTDAYNRHFFETYKKLFYNRPNCQKGIIYLDLNNLKLINDAFGHTMGDNTLKELVRIINSHTSDEDVICRIGGDEFVVFICRKTKLKLRNDITAIKTSVNKLVVNDFEVSSSVGYAVQTYPTQPVDEVIHLAEQNMYQEKIYASKSGKLKIVGSILSALYGKDPVEENHSVRVSKLMFSFAQVLGYSESDQFRLRSAGMLHDIGKIAINYNLLQSKKRLTVEEFEEIKRHPEIGYKILLSSRTEAVIAEATLMHHERIDGKGYPRGIPGNKISTSAKMLMICDSFDAMVSPRQYKKQRSIEDAIAEIKRCVNTQFDEQLAGVFIREVIPLNKDMYNEENYNPS